MVSDVGSCNHWLHGKCSGIHGKLVEDDSFRCGRCCALARPIDGCPCKLILVDNHNVEVVDSFYYLGGIIGAGSSCVSATIARTRTVWEQFRDLLSILMN